MSVEVRLYKEVMIKRRLGPNNRSNNINNEGVRASYFSICKTSVNIVGGKY